MASALLHMLLLLLLQELWAHSPAGKVVCLLDGMPHFSLMQKLDTVALLHVST